MAPKATVATLAVQISAIHAAVLTGQEAVAKSLDEIKGDIKGIRLVTTDHETRISRGEGTLSLLVKLVIGSVVASVAAVFGYIGRATGLW